MSERVRDRLLGDAKTRRLDARRDPLVATFVDEPRFNAVALLPCQVPPHRRRQSQVVEHRRSKFERQVAHLRDDPADVHERFFDGGLVVCADVGDWVWAAVILKSVYTMSRSAENR